MPVRVDPRQEPIGVVLALVASRLRIERVPLERARQVQTLKMAPNTMTHTVRRRMDWLKLCTDV